MTEELQGALIRRLTALADDELILAHRDGEWTGHAPILEEDIAIANIAQDELGHAVLLYGLRAELDDADPDRLAFFRDAQAFACAPLVELPRGDWAFTMVRQYLFDAYEGVMLDELAESRHPPLAAAAATMRREERFHLRHSALWVERLGLGTEESAGRARRALDTLWPYALGLFAPLDGDALLAAEGVFPDLNGLQESWLERVTAHLDASALPPPAAPSRLGVGRGRHTEHLSRLLSEMQSVARGDPQAAW